MVNKVKYIFNGMWIGLFLLGICFSHSGCKDEFTTDPENKLTMPDSLLFDTVFSKTISPTAIFKVYNETKENIKISSIVLESQSNYFQINVNGKSGTSFSDVEILSGDSLYVFVQIVADESGDDIPLLIDDKIKFLYNGNCQSVALSAYSQDVYHLREKIHIVSDTTWCGKKPFLVYDSIIVDSAATLTIKEGVMLYMKKNATMLVNGTLRIEGTLDNEVVFRTNRIDNVSKDLAFDLATNQWGGIHISSTSTGNKINYALIKGGAFGIEIDSAECNADAHRLVISNSHIHNAYSACLKANCANVLAYNSLFTNGYYGCVVLAGGIYQFDHCTISSHRTSWYALTMSNCGYAEKPSTDVLPFKAVFNNCILDGYTKREPLDEIYFRLFSTHTIDSLDFRFDHSLIYTDIPEEEIVQDEAHFNQVIVNQSPMYVLIDNTNGLFDFHLSEESPCKEKGDLGLVLHNDAYKMDRDGVIRDVEAAPDMGAYQMVVKSDSSAVNQ